jgi:DNA-binding XRE family transcriptional regulator
MNLGEKRALEEAGFRVGNFDEFLGMDESEARFVAHRADLGAAIRRIRITAGLTQVVFAKRVGVTQPKLARIEIGAPEISTDLMNKVYFKAGGSLSIRGSDDARRTPAAKKAAKPAKPATFAEKKAPVLRTKGVKVKKMV